MKILLKLEEAAMLALSVYALYTLHASWWWYLLLLIGPDISMLGYTAGNSTGAAMYNFFHHKAVAVIVFLTGFLLKENTLELTGIILFGHSSMDRMLGYGLKLKEGFQHTHLGLIGKKAGNSIP
jgi:hypothetical protein